MASGTGIGEFFVSLTVDASEGALTVGNLVQGMGALEVATLAEIGLLWELGVQLARVTDEGIKASLGFAQFTMHTGESAQELQRWQIVARQSHAAAEDVTGSVENLTKHLANLAVGIPDSSLGSLQQLGISAFDASGKLKGAFDILKEVQARLGVVTQNAGQQERILSGLGIAPNLRETLLLTEAAFNARAGVAHGMTGAQQADFDAMYQSFTRISLVALDIGRNIGAWVAHLNKVTGSLETLEKGFRFLRDVTEGKYSAPPLSPEEKAAGMARRKALEDFFAPSKETGAETMHRWLDSLTRPADAGYISPEEMATRIQRRDQMREGGGTVVIDKHDTYNIQTNDPEVMKKAIEEHWDDTMRRKTVDGFDRQLNNGGY